MENHLQSLVATTPMNRGPRLIAKLLKLQYWMLNRYSRKASGFPNGCQSGYVDSGIPELIANPATSNQDARLAANPAKSTGLANP